MSKYTNRLKTQTLYTSKTKIVLQKVLLAAATADKTILKEGVTKMKFLDEGVLLNFEEYADYINALAALAALRPVTSFQNNSSQEVEA